MIICNNCWEIFWDYDMHSGVIDGSMCPKKNCGGNTFELDELMFPTIKILNDEKGLITRFCCSGHVYDEYPSVYIQFADSVKLGRHDSLPKGFHTETSPTGNLVIRHEIASKDLNLYLEILTANANLLKWAARLRPRSNE
jgi:hypothetical protein